MSYNAPVLKEHKVYEDSDKLIYWFIWNTDETAVEDVTGWTFSFKLGPTQGGSYTLSKTVTIEDAAAGLVRVDLDPADVPTAGTFFYTLARTDSGYADALADGKFVVRPRVN